MRTSSVNITVMYSPAPRVVHERLLPLSSGVTVMQALQQSGLLAECPEIDLSQSEAFTVCIWGKKTSPDHVLRELDRAGLYDGFTVIGTQALYAYEAAAGAHFILERLASGRRYNHF